MNPEVQKNNVANMAQQVLSSAIENELEERQLKDRMWARASPFQRECFPKKDTELTEMLTWGAQSGRFRITRTVMHGDLFQRFFARVTTGVASHVPYAKQDEGWTIPDDDLLHQMGQAARQNPVLKNDRKIYIYQLIQTLTPLFPDYKFPIKHENKESMVKRISELGYLRRDNSFYQSSYQIIAHPYEIHCPTAMTDAQPV